MQKLLLPLFLITVLCQREIILNEDMQEPIFVDNANANIQNVMYEFYIQPSSTVSVGGQVMIEFPSQYTLDAGISCKIEDVQSTCSLSGKEVTIKTSIELNPNTKSFFKVTLYGVKNPSSSGGTGPFAIRTSNGDGKRILDQNLNIGSIGIADEPKTIKSFTVTSDSIILAGNVYTYIFNFKIVTPLKAGSWIRIRIPSSYQFTSTVAVKSMQYDSDNLAIKGALTGIIYDNEPQCIYIQGLSENLPADRFIRLQLQSLVNPAFEASAGTFSFQVATLYSNSRALIDLGSYGNPIISVNKVSTITLEPEWGALSIGNEVYCRLKFTITNMIEKTGSIQIDFGAKIASSTYIKTSIAALPIPTDGSSVLTLSSFSDKLAAQSKVEVLIKLTIPSTNFNVTVITKNSLSVQVDKGIKSITPQSYSKFTITEFNHLSNTVHKNDWETFDQGAIQLKFQVPSNIEFTTGNQVILIIYFPNSKLDTIYKWESLENETSKIECKIDGILVTTIGASKCSFSSQVLTLELEKTIYKGNNYVLEFNSQLRGFQNPYVTRGLDAIYEMNLQWQESKNTKFYSSYEVPLTVQNNNDLLVNNGNNYVNLHANNMNVYAITDLVVTTPIELKPSTGESYYISFYFESTYNFLGMSASGAVGCVAQNLIISTGTVSCNFYKSGDTSVKWNSAYSSGYDLFRVSGFKTVAIDTTIYITVLGLNPSTNKDIIASIEFLKNNVLYMLLKGNLKVDVDSLNVVSAWKTNSIPTRNPANFSLTVQEDSGFFINLESSISPDINQTNDTIAGNYILFLIPNSYSISSKTTVERNGIKLPSKVYLFGNYNALEVQLLHDSDLVNDQTNQFVVRGVSNEVASGLTARN